MPFFENVYIAADTVIFRSSIPKNQQVRPCARDAHAAKFSLKKHRELKKDFFNTQKPPLYFNDKLPKRQFKIKIVRRKKCMGKMVLAWTQEI